jgi:hypothetical protein
MINNAQILIFCLSYIITSVSNIYAAKPYQNEEILRKNASEIKIAQNATSELISSHCD